MEERHVQTQDKISQHTSSSNGENNTNNALRDNDRISRKYQLAEMSTKFRFNSWNCVGQFSEVIYID